MKKSINRRVFLADLATGLTTVVATISLACWGDQSFTTSPNVKQEEDPDVFKKIDWNQETHLLSGIVNGVSDSKSSLEGAVIPIYDSQGNLIRQVTSNGDGYKSELYPGDYQIRASHPDYHTKLFPDQIILLEDALIFNPHLLHKTINQEFFYRLKKGGEDNKPLTMWDLSGYQPSVALINPTDTAFRDIAIDILKNNIPEFSGNKLILKEPYVVYDPDLVPNTSSDPVTADVKIYWRSSEAMNGKAARLTAHVLDNIIYGANIYVADNLASSRKIVLLEAITRALCDIPNTNDHSRLFSSNRESYSEEGLKIGKAMFLLPVGW